MRVNIHRLTAEEADEGLAGIVGEVDGEAAGGGDGGDEGDAGSEGFLNHLEGDAAAEEQDVVIERQEVVHERMTEDLVEGVVTAHIFAGDDEVAFEVKNGAGVQAASFGKGLLGGAELVG
jgi:hypothetical protein